jgi:uncharacterized protein (DUF1697 family)
MAPVTKYVALLRAVNLGDHKKIAMPVLREVLTGLGYADVVTYLQSGNAVFSAAERPVERLTAEIEEGLAGGPGLATEVMIRTAGELRTVIDENPLEVRDPAKLAVLFLYRATDPEKLTGLEPERFAPEEMHAGEREIYFYFPNGIGRARLPQAVGRRLKMPATMRNWNTVTNLMALAAPRS